MKRFTPEVIGGIRRFLEGLPPGGLRPVEVPAGVARIMAEDLLYAADLEARHETLREAARALLDALDNGGLHACDICDLVATRLLTWEGDSARLCDRHAAKQLSGEDTAPLEDHEIAIAAPLRTLRALLEGGSR